MAYFTLDSDLEAWLETLEILSDEQAVCEIKRARQELEDGKRIPFEEVLKKL